MLCVFSNNQIAVARSARDYHLHLPFIPHFRSTSKSPAQHAVRRTSKRLQLNIQAIYRNQERSVKRPCNCADLGASAHHRYSRAAPQGTQEKDLLCYLALGQIWNVALFHLLPLRRLYKALPVAGSGKGQRVNSTHMLLLSKARAHGPFLLDFGGAIVIGD